MEAKYSLLVFAVVAVLLIITSLWFTPEVAEILP
ncbi:hypothetical protein MNBD_GAMMA07-62 [hydrothermal vent metagenome]|uniref:Uncharacterized protein n=1 Tax=hydrothermal vent metagenome TaxID=652676 RepID=A0A3B0WNG3_9ZZZZ